MGPEGEDKERNAGMIGMRKNMKGEDLNLMQVYAPKMARTIEEKEV